MVNQNRINQLNRKLYSIIVFDLVKKIVSIKSLQVLSADGLYDESLSLSLFHEVKILCWVFTHPDNHHNKSMHVRNLWGKRCNKLLFFSNEEDPVLGTIKLPVEKGRKYLWNKTILAYHYVSGSSQSFRLLDHGFQGSQTSFGRRRLVHETGRRQVKKLHSLQSF
jgi:hypothetical protein